MATPAIELRRVDPSGIPGPRFSETDNVVAFIRPGQPIDEEDIDCPNVAAGERCAASAPADQRPLLRTGLVLASVLAHIGLLALLSRPPQPMIGVEEAAIAVDLVMEPAPRQVADQAPQSAARPAPASPQARRDETPPSARAKTTMRTEAETAPAQSQSPQTHDPSSAENTAAAPATETPSVEPRSQPVEAAPVPPAPQGAGAAAPASKKEISAARPGRPLLRPAAEEKRPVPRRFARARAGPAAAPHRHVVRESTATHARIAALAVGRTAEPRSSRRAAPSADPNYYGRVAAHLARFKQYPADARNSHSEGVATVTFTIDAAGRVTSVRLVHAIGNASLDREAQAVAHRASPFPPPPTGRAMTFTVPVRFAIR